MVFVILATGDGRTVGLYPVELAFETVSASILPSMFAFAGDYLPRFSRFTLATCPKFHSSSDSS